MGTETLSSYVSATFAGITLTANGADNPPFTVTAAGTINAGQGVYSQIDAYLANFGTIIGSNDQGVYFTDGGTVTNFGPRGVIYGGAYGVDGINAPLTVTNTGTIASGGTGVYAGMGAIGYITNSGTISGGFQDTVKLGQGGTITNLGSSSLIYSKSLGIISDGVALITNAGTIMGATTFDGEGGMGIYLNDGGTVANTGAQAVIFGSEVGVLSQNLIFNNQNAPVTVINAGTIASNDAAIDLKESGGNRVVAEAGAVFIGAVEVTGTGNVLELAGTGSTIVSVGGQFTGFQTIAFDAGATWEIGGTSLSLATGQDITGFHHGDTIDITNILANTETFAHGLLTLANGATPLATLSLPEASGVTSADFVLRPDNASGTDITMLCYLHGTRILTPVGLVKVEDLAIGDAVVTRFGAVQRIKWLGRQRYAPEFLANNPEKWPVCIKAGALEDSVPVRDLYVSPGHSMLLGNTLVLAQKLVNGVTITRHPPAAEVSYVQIELAAHDCVLAEGAWSETYADAPGLRAQFHNAAEFYALYPDEPPADGLRLCAARPQGGERLNAALRQVAVRAASGIVPGRLQGYVEKADAFRVSGWAFDSAHPELPVVLEVCAGGKVLGQVVAGDDRADLTTAGKATGRGAFSFTSLVRITPEIRASLQIRRAVDHARLPIAPEIRPEPEAQASPAASLRPAG